MEINGEIVNDKVRYADLNLSPELMRAIDKKGYVQATPVQAGAIPYFMEWKDVIAKAPTGTGKTFAFGIPMVEHADPQGTQVTGLVLAPTRELAIQIRDELRDLCAFKEGVRTVCLYGGQPIDKQILQLKKAPQIVVATPGRLMDHVKRRTVRLDKVETVVLDEADRMLDMGFVRDVTRILDLMPKRKNLGMFSATISREVMDISWVYQRDPVEITVRADQENKPDILQYRLEVERNRKVDTMVRLMELGGYAEDAGHLLRGHPRGHPAASAGEDPPALPKRGAAGAGGHRCGRPGTGYRRCGRGVQLRRARRERVLYPPHRPDGPGPPPRSGLYPGVHHH